MSDLYPYYKNARDLAWLILLDKQLTAFPIDVPALLTSFGIRFKPFSACRKFLAFHKVPPDAWAFTIPLNGVYYLAFNDANTTTEQLRFTLAHELGHILTGCTPTYGETQGNIFARDLLMPAIVCKVENLTTPEDIAAFFGVSLPAATIRATRIAELLKRNKWLSSPLEKKYYELYMKRKKARI